MFDEYLLYSAVIDARIVLNSKCSKVVSDFSTLSSFPIPLTLYSETSHRTCD